MLYLIAALVLFLLAAGAFTFQGLKEKWESFLPPGLILTALGLAAVVIDALDVRGKI